MIRTWRATVAAIVCVAVASGCAAVETTPRPSGVSLPPSGQPSSMPSAGPNEAAPMAVSLDPAYVANVTARCSAAAAARQRLVTGSSTDPHALAKTEARVLHLQAQLLGRLNALPGPASSVRTLHAYYLDPARSLLARTLAFYAAVNLNNQRTVQVLQHDLVAQRRIAGQVDSWLKTAGLTACVSSH